jgi:MFS family permease
MLRLVRAGALSSLRAVPRGVLVLGIVSLLMDASSELVHALLPLFMVTVLGASAIAVGVIEGVAEATALIVKVFSGYLSDRARRRKPLVLAGYGIAALSKIAFPLGPDLSWIVGARVVDRIGKGIRGAPRDALIADLAPADARGASFGLRQALDTVGAVLGPLLAVAAMAWFAGNFRSVFWFALIPAALAVALIVVGVREPTEAHASQAKRLTVGDVRRLDRRFYIVTAIAAVLTLARFSEAFLVLRAQNVGMTLGDVPWVMVAMSAVYAVIAFPAGALADRGHSSVLIAAGLGALVASNVVLANAASPALVIVGTALWGLHLALTQGLLSALVAAVAPADLRGTAFGVFNVVSGIAMLAASTLAGALWELAGPSYTFYAGAVFTTLAAAGLWWRRRDVPALA